MRVLLARIYGMLRRAELERRLDEELRFHLDMEAEANRRRGMSPAAAECAARRAFGGEQQTKEIYRDRRGLPMLELLFKDLRFGLRMIRRSPGFTMIAVLSLALGIGANTAIFTLIDAVMLRSMPVPSPHELVSIGNAARPGTLSNGGPNLDLFSYPLYQRVREGNGVFTGLLASGRTGRLEVKIGDGGEEPVRGRMVSGNYFEVLGVQPSLGRLFGAEEDRAAGASPVVAISYEYWQSRFARDPAIPGRTLKLNGAVFTIIGVGPRGFTGEVAGSATDVWVPLTMQAQINPGDRRLENREASWLLLIGRLRPGVTLARASAEMAGLAAQAVIDFRGIGPASDEARELRAHGLKVQPGSGGFSPLRSRFSKPLLTLMIVVGLVLLIACANVANLLLARAAGRQKEIAVRLAVGASRGRLVRQLLTESVLLAAAGGTAGLLLAWAGSGLLLRLAAGGSNPILLDVRPDSTMLAFTAVVSLLTGLLFGLAPALRSTRTGLGSVMKENGRGVTGGGWGLGKLLVIAQVALSLVLLDAGGLFLRSLANLETLDVGYRPERLAVLRIDPAGNGYNAAQLLPMARRLIGHLRSVPGVLGATVSENGIFGSTDSSSGVLRIEGFSSTRKEDLKSSADQIGPHYFQVAGVPLLAGREFDDRDAAGTPRVTILNETMARFYFGGADPVGKTIQDDDDRYTVIGVARDMKERDLKGKTERRFYLPYFQVAGRVEGMYFEIKTRDDAALMLPAIRREAEMFDRGLKIMSLAPVRTLIDQTIGEERLIAELSGFFGVLALLLAATGLYGVMAYATSRRANEIGLRMALGASPGEVTGMVLRETLALVAAGIAVGAPAALAASRLIAATLTGLSASDPATLGAAAVTMLLVAVFAGWAPARRAARIDPIVALRQA